MNVKARTLTSGKSLFRLAAGLLTTFLATSAARAGSVQQITSFGANPSGIGMYLYTPAKVAAKPPILVGIHACHGKGTDVCANGTGFAAQADKYGFLLICPSAISSDGCWDVHSTGDLTHNGAGDASGIMSMVNYVIQNMSADASRVYAAGHSSGGMMTNVLLGSYPDVFKAGAAFAGVAFGCFAVGQVDSLGWNSGCANGNVTKTAAAWGDTVRAAYPGFTGTRPRMQLWHGTTDAIVNFKNLAEEIKQWTNVLGVSESPTTTENDTPRSTWIRTRYVDKAGVVQVEAVQETGQPHNLVVDIAAAVQFFGLDGTTPTVDAGVRDSSAGDVQSGAGGASFGTGGAVGDAGVGGNRATGGRAGTGGASAGGSGGVVATGGNGAGGSGTGGGQGSTGGLSGTGGATGGASAVGTGGAGTGGAIGTGGDAFVSGGNLADAGTAGSQGATGRTGGCACDLGSSSERGHHMGLTLSIAALGICGKRRRRTPRKS